MLSESPLVSTRTKDWPKGSIDPSSNKEKLAGDLYNLEKQDKRAAWTVAQLRAQKKKKKEVSEAIERQAKDRKKLSQPHATPGNRREHDHDVDSAMTDYLPRKGKGRMRPASKKEIRTSAMRDAGIREEKKTEVAEGIINQFKKSVKRHKKAVADKKIKNRRAVPYEALTAETQPEGQMTEGMKEYEALKKEIHAGRGDESKPKPKGKSIWKKVEVTVKKKKKKKKKGESNKTRKQRWRQGGTEKLKSFGKAPKKVGRRGTKGKIERIEPKSSDAIASKVHGWRGSDRTNTNRRSKPKYGIGPVYGKGKTPQSGSSEQKPKTKKLEIISLKKKANESFVQSGQERRASEWKTEMDAKTQRMKYGKNWKQVKKDMESSKRRLRPGEVLTPKKGGGWKSNKDRSAVQRIADKLLKR